MYVCICLFNYSITSQHHEIQYLLITVINFKSSKKSERDGVRKRLQKD